MASRGTGLALSPLRPAAAARTGTPPPAEPRLQRIAERPRAHAAEASPAAAEEAVESARAAGLRYIRDAGPGIRRRRAGRGFLFLDPAGRPVRGAGELARIRALAVPPAWRDVWICPDPRGYLQATGRDARGRKQYRYHPRFRAVRDETKYERMIGFGQALPGLRERVDTDLSRPGLPRPRVLATVIRLLDQTFMRVGNEAYARENGSFGLTTMREEHVDVSGATVQFEFRSKSGKTQSVRLEDRRVARVLRRCQELPGQELFQYLDEAGGRQTIDSADVNGYLREAMGRDFTAKDFRTWGASVLAASQLRTVAPPRSARHARSVLVHVAERVAHRLGNTPAICRKSYIHPAVIQAYLDGWACELEARAGHPGLAPDETFLLCLLEAAAARSAPASAPTRRRKPSRPPARRAA
jgi:DNA topoisomerase-1